MDKTNNFGEIFKNLNKNNRFGLTSILTDLEEKQKDQENKAFMIMGISIIIIFIIVYIIKDLSLI